MEKLLSLELNIFIMMAVGFMVRKLNIMGPGAQKDLTNLVLYVVLPCNIFNSFLGQDVSGLAADCVIVVLVSVGIQILSLVYGKFCFPKENADHRCNLAYGMICSNAGFLGNPIAEGVFGATGLMLGSLYLIPQRVMMWSEGLAIYTGVSDKKDAFKRVITHPCVIACILGIIMMVAGWSCPQIILTPIQTLGKCNTPLSMMVIGMILSSIDLRTIINKTVVRFTVHRLVLMPLVVWGLCRLIGLSHVVTGVSVLLAAMPAGATTSMLSAKYDRDPQFATKLVVFSTLCSIPAIFAWSILLTV